MTPPVTPNYSYGGMGTNGTSNHSFNFPRAPTGLPANNLARDGHGMVHENSMKTMKSNDESLASERLAVDNAFGTLPRTGIPRTTPGK